MASPEQRMNEVDKSSGSAAVVANQKDKSNHSHRGHTHPHVRESVLDIDEETRMGPEMSNDDVTHPSTFSCTNDFDKDKEGTKTETSVPASGEESEKAGPPPGSSFSALSLLAAEYGESDNNSSPRSTNSPAVVEESVPVSQGPNVFNVATALPQMLQDNFETKSMSLDTGDETSKSQLVLDPVTGEMVDTSKVLKDVPAKATLAAEKNIASATSDSQDGLVESQPAEAGDNGCQKLNLLTDDSPLNDPEPMETVDSRDDKGVTDTANMSALMDTNSMTNMSEDSKQVSNLDWDESLDGSIQVKRPSTIPFGENANSSMPLKVDKALLVGDNSNVGFVDESSQSNSQFDKPSRTKKPRRNSITDIQDSKAGIEDCLQPFTAARIFEYQWPQDGGEWYLLQEQLSEYLGVLSFKRKYPDLTRRTCDKMEKDFLRERGVVSETQSDLGLTAVRSEEVYDLMMKDYPEKYHEYAAVLHQREKQKISDKHKEYEQAQLVKLEKSKMVDYMKKAAKSAADYNRNFLRERREERAAYFDLQTFLIQYPGGRYKKLPAECTKPSAYPVALIPGQYQDHYCSYTSDELRYFPLNTALYDPPKKMKNMLAKPGVSGESSSDDSEEKSGSSSDSSGSGSSDSDASAPTATNGSAAATSTSAAAATPVLPKVEASPAPTPVKKSHKKGAGKTPAGKSPGKTPSKTPGKTPGKTPSKTSLKTPGKLKRKREAMEEEKQPQTPALAEVATSTSSPAPLKLKEEEEDKDKCRICKNAVLFLKYKRVETKMIKCSECGKLAHPSCLDLTDKMVQVVSTYPWQCMECKTCVECMDPYDEDKMLFCDRCDRGYHTFCVGLRCLPTGRWECRSCKGVAAEKSR